MVGRRDAVDTQHDIDGHSEHVLKKIRNLKKGEKETSSAKKN